MQKTDIIIIGAGIAGASLAAELASHAQVLLVEAEEHPGYHSTGRSAAFWSESYGGPAVQPLTRASGLFLHSPPLDFGASSFLRPRGALHVADQNGLGALRHVEEEFKGAGLVFESLDQPALSAIISGLRSGWEKGLYERSCADIDVAALHAAYLKMARQRGATLVCSARAQEIEYRQKQAFLHTTNGTYRADIVVNAAGAWADEIAKMAGIPPIGIQPYRRTIAQIRIDPPAPVDLPLIIDARGRFYLKPAAGGRIWLTPHDETACPAGDCAAHEQDIALAIDRLQKFVDWRVERVEHSWAGLRSFAPDRLPIYGYAPGFRNFFWFAGQGGFGIQTAPAAAKLAAAMLLGNAPDPLVSKIDPGPYLADRFAN